MNKTATVKVVTPGSQILGDSLNTAFKAFLLANPDAAMSVGQTVAIFTAAWVMALDTAHSLGHLVLEKE